MKTKSECDWSIVFTSIFLALAIAASTWFTIESGAKLSARIDRLEADNLLQQQMITELGQKVEKNENR